MPLATATLGQISLVVKDLEAAKEFYVDQLSLTLLFSSDNLLFLSIGDTRIMLTADGGSEENSNSILYFKVPDLDASYARLQELGVRILQTPCLVAPMPDHDLYMVFFADPGGNTLALMHEAPKGSILSCVQQD